MPIGDPISQPVPAVGTAGTTYASELVAFLQEVKARLEAKVALTSLLAGLFDLNNNGIANARYVGLYEQTSVPSTPVGSIQKYGGELYYVSPSGAVRITLNGALDTVGANGITGDYAAPAEFRYSLPDLEYYAYSDQTASPKHWARLGAQGVDLYGTLTGTTRVRIAWAGGANPSYTWTLPATLPSTQQLLQVDNAGQLVASNTIPQDVTLAVNKNVTLSGTGKVFFGEYSYQQMFRVEAGSGWSSGTWSSSANATGANDFSVAIGAATSVGYCELKCINSYHKWTGILIDGALVSGSGNVTYDVMRRSNSTGQMQSILTAPIVATGATANITNFAPPDMNAGYSYFVKVTMPAAGSYALYNVQSKYTPR